MQELELKRYEQVVTKLAGEDTKSVAAPTTRKARVAELEQKTDAILDKGDYETAATGDYSAILTLDQLNALVGDTINTGNHLF